MSTHSEVLNFVNRATTTVTELQQVAAAYAIPQTGNRLQIRTRVRTAIAAQPDQNGNSPFTVVTPPPPLPPVNNPPPPPVNNPPPANNSRNSNSWLIAGIIAVIVVVLLCAGAYIVGNALLHNTFTVDRSILPPVVPTTVTNTGNPAQTPADPQVAHFDHLVQLDPIFRSQGLDAWLKAAGFTWSSLTGDARQVEEETTHDGKIVVAGIQIKGMDVTVQYPACVTTDQPSRITSSPTTRQYRPDQRNASVIYTNVTAHDQVTIWADCSNWSQIAPLTTEK